MGLHALPRTSHGPGQTHSEVPRVSVTRPRFSAAAGRRFGLGAVVRVDRGSPGFVSSRGYQVSRGTRVGLPGRRRVLLEGWRRVSPGCVRHMSGGCWCTWASCQLTRGVSSASLSS